MEKSARKIDALKKKMAELETTEMPQKAVDRYESSIQKAQKKVDSLLQKMKEVADKEIISPKWNKISEEIDEIIPRLEELRQKKKQAIAWTGSETSAEAFMPGVFKELQELEEKYARLNEARNKLEASGRAFKTGADTEEYRDLQKQLDLARGQLKAAQTNYDEEKALFQETLKNKHANAAAELSREQEELNGLTSRYQALQRQISGAARLETLASGFGKIVSAAQNAFAKISSTAGTVVKAVKGIGSGLQSVAKGFANLAKFGAKAVMTLSGLGSVAKGISSSISGLGKRIFDLAKSALIFNVLSAGFRQVTSGIGSAFETYLGYDAGLKSAINGLRAQLSALQGSLASAFAPVVSAVVPYLSTLISWVTTAANAVAQFIAVLTGHSSYKKAVANVGAVGAAADGAAGSLGDATKAAEELEKALGNYDELKVIDQPKDSSGGGSGGGGGGGAGGAGDITYEDVEIASAVSDFAEKVKEAWMNSDFTEVGGIIGQKLNEALEAIPWDGIQATAQKIGKSLATLINGFVETAGLGETVGKTVGEAINTGILGVESFTGNLHFDSIGQFVANGINGALTTIKWDNLTSVANNLGSGLASALNKVMTVDTFSNIGKSFANAVNTVISGAYSFVSSADWKGWGNAIASSVNNFFSGFDWKKAGLTFSNAAKGMLDTLCSAVKGISWSAVGTDIADALKTVDWGGLLQSAADLICSTFSGLLDFAGAVITRLGGSEWDNYMLDVKNVTKELSDANTAIENRIQKASEWSQAGDEYDYAKKLADEYFTLAGKENLTNAEKNRMKELAGELKDTIPQLETYYNTETGLLDITRDSVNNLIESLKAKARTEAAQDALKELYSAQMDAKKSMDETKEALGPLQQEYENLSKKYEYYNELEQTAIKNGELLADGNTEYSSALNSVRGEMLRVEGQMKPLNEEYERANQAYEDAQTEIDAVTGYLVTYSSQADTASQKTDNLAKKFENLSKESQVTISLSMQGLDVSKQAKLDVIAEVTGVDASKLPYSEKGIDDMYANIVEAYAKQGVTVETPVTTTKILPNGQVLSTGVKATVISANGKTMNVGMKASAISANGKIVTAGVKSKAISANGKTVTAGVKSKSISANGKKVTATVKANRIVKAVRSLTLGGVTASITNVVKGGYLVLSGIVGAITSIFRREAGGVYNGGIWKDLPQKASGGIFNHGIWGNIPAYASGGSPHGTMFVAGEAGPEIVGHVGGRTEVLNKSQLASTMYSAVLSAMSEAVSSLGAAILQHMTERTNMMIVNLGNILDAIYAAGNMPSLQQLQFASGAAMNYTVPDTNVINAAQGAVSYEGSAIDYDKLAGAVASRISNNSSYQFIAQLNGRTIFDETVRQNQLYIKQTGTSAFER